MSDIENVQNGEVPLGGEPGNGVTLQPEQIQDARAAEDLAVRQAIVTLKACFASVRTDLADFNMSSAPGLRSTLNWIEGQLNHISDVLGG